MKLRVKCSSNFPEHLTNDDNTDNDEDEHKVTSEELVEDAAETDNIEGQVMITNPAPAAPAAYGSGSKNMTTLILCPWVGPLKVK